MEPGLVFQNYISLKKVSRQPKPVFYSQTNNNLTHLFPLHTSYTDSNYYCDDKFPLQFYKEQPHNILTLITLCTSKPSCVLKGHCLVMIRWHYVCNQSYTFYLTGHKEAVQRRQNVCSEQRSERVITLIAFWSSCL